MGVISDYIMWEARREFGWAADSRPRTYMPGQLSFLQWGQQIGLQEMEIGNNISGEIVGLILFMATENEMLMFENERICTFPFKMSRDVNHFKFLSVNVVVELQFLFTLSVCLSVFMCVCVSVLLFCSICSFMCQAA